MESSNDPFPWCGECGTWHAPDEHVSISERDAFAFSAEISRLTLALAAETTRANLYASKLQHWRTDEPPRSVLLLTWVRGVKEHSGAMWTREGYWLMPWHGEDGWAAQFRNAACKHLDADTLDVVGWMQLPEQPR